MAANTRMDRSGSSPPPGRRPAAEGDEVDARPDVLGEVALHRRDVVDGRLRAPAPREPHPDATPQVTGGVVAPALDGVQPRVVALVAAASSGEGDVEVYAVESIASGM